MSSLHLPWHQLPSGREGLRCAIQCHHHRCHSVVPFWPCRGCSHERSRAKRSRSRGRSSPKARTHRSPAGRSQRGSSRGRAERSRGRGQRSNSRVRTQHSRGHSQRSRSRDRSQRRTNRGHSQRRNSRGRSQRSRSKGHSPIKRASFADVWKVANTQLQIPGIGVTVPKRCVGPNRAVELALCCWTCTLQHGPIASLHSAWAALCLQSAFCCQVAVECLYCCLMLPNAGILCAGL